MKRKSLAPEKLMEPYRLHVGHTITPWTKGDLPGVLLRVSYRADINAVQLWLDVGQKIPQMIFSDQVQECSCGEGKKKGA